MPTKGPIIPRLHSHQRTLEIAVFGRILLGCSLLWFSRRHCSHFLLLSSAYHGYRDTLGSLPSRRNASTHADPTPEDPEPCSIKVKTCES